PPPPHSRQPPRLLCLEIDSGRRSADRPKNIRGTVLRPQRYRDTRIFVLRGYWFFRNLALICASLTSSASSFFSYSASGISPFVYLSASICFSRACASRASDPSSALVFPLAADGNRESRYVVRASKPSPFSGPGLALGLPSPLSSRAGCSVWMFPSLP